MKKELVLKISVVALILLALGGMWLIKHNTDKINEQKYNQILESNQSNIPEQLKDADFSFEITQPVDFKIFSEHNLPLIVNFGADWCGPCQQMKPGYKNVYAKMQGKAFIKYIDTEKSPYAVGDVPISVIPTQIFFNSDGTPFAPSKSLAKKINFTFYRTKYSNEVLYTVHQGILTENEIYLILDEMGVDTK